MDPSTSHAGLAARLAVGWPGAQAPSGRSAAALMVPPSRAFPVRCRPLVAICGVASLLAHHPGPQRGGGVWAERRAAPRAGGSGRGLGVRRALPGGLQGDVWAPLGLKATGIGLNHSGGQVPRSQILGLEAGLQSSRDPPTPYTGGLQVLPFRLGSAAQVRSSPRHSGRSRRPPALAQGPPQLRQPGQPSPT